MPHPPFDPTKAVLFDLSKGLVHLEDASARLLVPAAAIATLAKAAGPEATQVFTRSLGEPLGLRVAKHLAGEESARSALVDVVIDHLGGELALVGLGSLALERWGRAMLLLVEQSPLGAEGDSLLASVLEAALSKATGRDVRCVSLMRDGVRARFLVAGGAAAERAQSWLKEGVSWGEVLARLHAPAEPRVAS
jgi:hypothetical protein